ncbi:hypothetical protein EBS02_08095, partial [bacterium]|nr:hypothetical protein [bacterium]
DFWLAKQTYGNYFYKKINQGYRFVCAIFAGFFDIEHTHKIYLAIRKFFGFSTIVGEFHENSLHFCSNSGVFPFIKNENQEHYKVTPGPFYVGDYSGLSGFDVSLILQSADYGFMKRVIIDEYLKHMREEDGYSFSIHTLEKHFKECLHEHDWASLKGFEHDLDYSSYAESIQKLAEILVIIQLMNQGIFLLKSEILKEIQMKEDQTVKNDAETITEQYGDCIPNHFNLYNTFCGRLFSASVDHAQTKTLISTLCHSLWVKS